MRKLSENICRKLLKLLIVESNQHFLNPLADPLGINPPWTPFGRRPQFENHCARGRCVCGSVAAVLQGTTWVVYSKLLSPAAAAAATMAFRHIDWSFVDRTRGGGNVARRQWSQEQWMTRRRRVLVSPSARCRSDTNKQLASPDRPWFISPLRYRFQLLQQTVRIDWFSVSKPARWVFTGTYIKHKAYIKLCEIWNLRPGFVELVFVLQSEARVCRFQPIQRRTDGRTQCNPRGDWKSKASQYDHI